MNVSVCIPTYERPSFVEAALQSCLDQTLLPHEILIGDDSPGDRTAKVAAKYTDCEDVAVRYFHNQPGLGQAGNVDKLFRHAGGDKIMLLHDDDLLLPNALSDLAACFDADSRIVAAYGKQRVIAHNGRDLPDIAQGLNEGYYRTKAYEGVQPSALRAAILQQFPNDGFMVDAEAAKDVGYASQGVGDACDFAFGIRLAENGGRFFFCNEYTAKYRHSEDSIGRGEDRGDAAYFGFKKVLDTRSVVQQDEEVQRWLRRKAPVAVMTAAQNGYVKDGLKWYFGPHHRHRIFSLGGARRLLALLDPRKRQVKDVE